VTTDRIFIWRTYRLHHAYRSQILH